MVNIWTILLSMIASVALGFVWYGPLFGKKWMALSGISVSEKPPVSMMIKPIILSFIGAALMSWVLSFSIAFHNAFYQTVGWLPNASMAFMLWLGFVVPVYLNFVGWEGKPKTLFLINVGYWLVFMLISASIITLFV